MTVETDTTPRPPKKPRRKLWWAAGIAGVLLIGGIAAGADAGDDTAPTAGTPTTTAPTEPAEPPATAAAEEPAVEDAADVTPDDTTDLAASVEAELKQGLGVQNFTDGFAGPDPDMLWWYISSIKNDSPGDILVTVQLHESDTSDEEVEWLAAAIMRLTQDTHPDLDWVMVQTADGRILEQAPRLG